MSIMKSIAANTTNRIYEYGERETRFGKRPYIRFGVIEHKTSAGFIDGKKVYAPLADENGETITEGYTCEAYGDVAVTAKRLIEENPGALLGLYGEATAPKNATFVTPDGKTLKSSTFFYVKEVRLIAESANGRAAKATRAAQALSEDRRVALARSVLAGTGLHVQRNPNR